MVAALKRLANAQLQVAQIEATLAESAHAGAAVVVDPGDVAELEDLVAELAKLAKKSQSRFGGGSARGRSAELEAKQRLVLGRMGFASYEDYVAACHASASAADAAPSVDPVVVGFARRELAAAEAVYRELLLLPDEVETDDEGESGSDPGDDGSATTIDLTG